LEDGPRSYADYPEVDKVAELIRRTGYDPYLFDAVRVDRQPTREEWQRRRALGLQRRRALVAERLQQPPELPGWMTALPTDALTAKQREALVLRYGYGLTYSEAAEVAGIAKTSMRERLEGAELKVQRHLGLEVQRRAANPDQCEECGRIKPSGLRRDARYCSAVCRQRAYRARAREKARTQAPTMSDDEWAAYLAEGRRARAWIG
jgi:predicted DNA-binding protein (UPF0251 family)